MSIRLNGKEAFDKIRDSGKKYIIGIDECGTGCISGPLYSVAFLAPIDWNMDGLNDSKKLSANQRSILNNEILEESRNSYGEIQFATGVSTSVEIDKEGLHPALKKAYLTALNYVRYDIEDNYAIVLDGILSIPGVRHFKLPKADSIIPQVMAASILGKVARDNYMIALANKYPKYGFEKHKGYPTKDHKAALNKYGLCPEHRRSYAPIKLIEGK